MACRACTGGGGTKQAYQVRWPATGRVRRFATEAEARAVAAAEDGVFEFVRR